MRNKSKILTQKQKRRLSIFLRFDQWEELKIIKENSNTYMLDVLEEIIDLGLRSYYGDTRDIGDQTEEGNYFLYD